MCVGGPILNPVDFEEIVCVNVAKRYDKLLAKMSKDLNRVNLLRGNIKVGKSNAHCRVRDLLYFQKR